MTRRSRKTTALGAALAVALLASSSTAQSPPPTDARTLAVAHLLRRATFGPKPGQADELARNFPTIIVPWLNDQIVGDLQDSQEFEDNLESFGPPLDLTSNPAYGSWTINDLAEQQVARATATENQLREVMTYFWRIHFNTNYSKLRKVFKEDETGLTDGMLDSSGNPITDENVRLDAAAAYLELEQILAFRANALESFHELLKASGKGLAMLLYLDGYNNKMDSPDAQPNENYARELVELHCLGKGDKEGQNFQYTEDDIELLAQALAGLTITQVATTTGGGVAWDAVFIDSNHQDQSGPLFNSLTTTPPLSLAGFSGEQEYDEVLRFLADAHETKVWVCRKLIEFFVGYRPRDELDPNFSTTPIVVSVEFDQDLRDLLDDCVLRWNAGGVSGNIAAVLDEILKSNVMFSAEARWARISTPVENAVALLRGYDAVQPTPLTITRLMNALEFDLDQRLFRFPTPLGFTIENLKQLSTSGYLFRSNIGQRMHRGYLIPDATGTDGAGYLGTDINWYYLRFFLPTLLVSDDPLVNFNVMLAYLKDYSGAVALGYPDIGDVDTILGAIVDGLFQKDVSTQLYDLLYDFVQTMPDNGVPGTLTELVVLSNPDTNPDGWADAIIEHGLRLNQIMSFAASLPQSILK